MADKIFTQEEARRMWHALDRINTHVWDRAGRGEPPDKDYILKQIESTLEPDHSFTDAERDA